MTPLGDKRSAVADPADAERNEHPDSFDPGPETGYLRRGRRDHELELDGGSEPFDPGPDHYDGRRAKRAARHREKAERKRRKRERAERKARETEQRRARERAAARVEAEEARESRERRKHEQSARAERERIERERALVAERDAARRAERERAERADAERERLRREGAERVARERAEHERIEREEREQAAADARERDRVAAQRIEAKRRALRAAAGEDRDRNEERARALRVRRAPQPGGRKPRPRLSEEPAHLSLRRPTAKVGLALAAVTAVAAAAGSALGLPIPGLGGGSADRGSSLTGAADAAAIAFLDGGTPVGLSKGPYHPVVGSIGYGETAAKFGSSRGGRSHEGQDVFAKPGSPLVAVRAGEVVDESPETGRYSGGRGNYVVVYSQLDQRSYVYLHLLKRALVRKGDSVAAGQPLGQVGCTGSCDGPHLHFEVRNGRQTLRAETKAVDPLPLLKQWPQVPLPRSGR